MQEPQDWLQHTVRFVTSYNLPLPHPTPLISESSCLYCSDVRGGLGGSCIMFGENGHAKSIIY